MNRWTKHIVIEGPDCIGKTTLAKTLADSLGYEYWHEGIPAGAGSLLQYYAERLMWNKSTVFDRLHVGETVYGPIMRHGSRLSSAEMNLMQRLVLATGTLVVVCQSTLDHALSRWRASDRGEYVKDEETYTRIWQGFADHESLNCYHDTAIFPDPVRAIQVSKALHPGYRDFVGSPAAKYVFVGERCNALPDEFHLPFFSINGSSGYLTARIAEAGFLEAEIAFTNALDVDGQTVNLRDKIHPSQQVIALGGVAHAVLAVQQVKHVQVNHPQYWKRFRSNQPETYVAELKRAKEEARETAQAST